MAAESKNKSFGVAERNTEKGKSEFVFCGYKAVLTRKKMKYIRVRIAEDGTLMISAPIRAPIARVTDFLQLKEEWIRQKVNESLRASEACPKNAKPDVMPIWGNPCPVIYKEGTKPAIAEEGGAMVVTLPCREAESDILALFNRFYRRILEKEAAARLPFWEAQTGLRSAGVSVRAMHTRWGSCTAQSKTIRVALNLATKPKACLDMVLVHELGHILYPNHGKMFYKYLDSAYPEWREVKKILNAKKKTSEV